MTKLYSIMLTNGQWLCNPISKGNKPCGFVQSDKQHASRFMSRGAAHSEASFQGLRSVDYVVQEV